MLYLAPERQGESVYDYLLRSSGSALILLPVVFGCLMHLTRLIITPACLLGRYLSVQHCKRGFYIFAAVDVCRLELPESHQNQTCTWLLQDWSSVGGRGRGCFEQS